MMMRTIYILLAASGLALVLIPSLLFYFDSMENEQMKTFMFLGTLLWFAGAIPWLGRKKEESKGS
jgi:hypothetical protein